MASAHENPDDVNSIHDFLAQFRARDRPALDEPSPPGHPPASRGATSWYSVAQSSPRVAAVFSSSEPALTGAGTGTGPATHTGWVPSVDPDRFELRPLHEQAAPPGPSALASYRIPCEFARYTGCTATFDAFTQAEAWIEHELEVHLDGQGPPACLCWFCDDFKFVVGPAGDRRETFRARMMHIVGHFQAGAAAGAVRPDFSFLDHVRERGLIGREVFEKEKRVREVVEKERRVREMHVVQVKGPRPRRHGMTGTEEERDQDQQGGQDKKKRDQVKSQHGQSNSETFIGVSYDSTTAGDAPQAGTQRPKGNANPSDRPKTASGERPKTGVGLTGNSHDTEFQAPAISAPRDPQVISDSSTWRAEMGGLMHPGDEGPVLDHQLQSPSPLVDDLRTRPSKTFPGLKSILQWGSHPAYWGILYWARRATGAVSEAFRRGPPNSFVSVGWNCRCGKRLNIEVPEHYLEGARRFAQQAAGPSHSGTVSTTHSSGPATPSPESQTPSPSHSSESLNPSTPPSTVPSEGTAPHPAHAPGTKRYLLLCVNSGLNLTTMRNIDLTNIGHDEVLFHKLRETYREMREVHFRNPFVVPQTVQYVQFELMTREKTGSCVGNLEPDCVPPVKEVYGGRYAYRPCPPDIGRYPMHPHVFMHSFMEPGDHTGCLAVERLPKKMHSILNCGSPLDLPVGWGIYIIEGLNWRLIRIVVLAAMLVTLCLALGWGIRMRDVQGGSGIGSYSATLVAISLSVTLLGRTVGV